jgi:hypothetical protein
LYADELKGGSWLLLKYFMFDLVLVFINSFFFFYSKVQFCTKERGNTTWGRLRSFPISYDKKSEIFNLRSDWHASAHQSRGGNFIEADMRKIAE